LKTREARTKGLIEKLLEKPHGKGFILERRNSFGIYLGDFYLLSLLQEMEKVQAFGKSHSGFEQTPGTLRLFQCHWNFKT